MKLWVGIAAAGLIVGGAVVWMFANPEPRGSLGKFDYESPKLIAQGKGVYQAECAACHGENLEGEANWREQDSEGYLPAPPHDQSGHTWHHPDTQLFAITKFGTAAVVGSGYQTRMQGFGGILGDDEIVAVLAFIKSTWPQHVINTHNRINRESE